MTGGRIQPTTRSSPKPSRTLEPIPSVEAAQEAASQIRQAIIDGIYKPGDRLIERELTEQLNVSRHPVREALRLLAREGFVILHRNRGAEVSTVDVSDVTEVYAIRMALGNLALDHVLGNSGKMSADDLLKLQELYENASTFAKQKRHDDAVSADLDFQQAIVNAARLERVSKYFQELTEDVRRYDKALGIIYTDQERYIDKYMKPMLAALGNSDLAGARSAWQDKFAKAVERFRSAIEGHELDGAQRTNRVKAS